HRKLVSLYETTGQWARIDNARQREHDVCRIESRRRQISDFAFAECVNASSILRLQTHITAGRHDNHFRLCSYFELKICGSGLGGRDDQAISRNCFESGLADFNPVSPWINGIKPE